MSEDGVPKKAGAQRRRRQNVKGGRAAGGARVDVKLSADEAAVLKARAADQKVSLPRLLVETTLAGETGQTPTQRRDDMAQLFALQRTLGGIATNINQLAKHANADGVFPQQAFDLKVRLNGLFDRIEQLLDDVANPAAAATRRPVEPDLEDDQADDVDQADEDADAGAVVDVWDADSVDAEDALSGLPDDVLGKCPPL
ncbi:MobC family plasmid mobilization relaxosome protein [Kribbella sp. NPDC056345]|uniref:MobC family plasmid mobilization relaxosome protein n=1 Tax=Kribbella sp. NPDC056345 TaxID=3345789 RepID=UPI0035DBC864